MENIQQSSIMIEVGAGELIDKITILKIKTLQITDETKIRNVRRELNVLNQAYAKYLTASPELDALENELTQVNQDLWKIEDDIRACEAARDFGSTFIELARSVYIQNDRRAALKKAINELSGSSIIEEKSYTKFS